LLPSIMCTSPRLSQVLKAAGKTRVFNSKTARASSGIPFMGALLTGGGAMKVVMSRLESVRNHRAAANKKLTAPMGTTNKESHHEPILNHG
jgi:hypothetical protein